MSRVSLVASYIIDWVVLIAGAGGGYALGNLSPLKRPFNLEDPSISFPFTEHETVTLTTLALVSILAPIVIVFLICLVVSPYRETPKDSQPQHTWRRKLWELHAGWLGLAFSIVGAWFITNGLKNMFGKPRPDLLARCHPDLANAAQFVVGGINTTSADGRLVSSSICQYTNLADFEDGFRSFPSGHSSSSAAGLIYLSLFLASKFAASIPSAGPTRASVNRYPRSTLPSLTGPKADNLIPLESVSRGGEGSSSMGHIRANKSGDEDICMRKEAAAPPLYLFVIAVVPFFASVFIASSRWFDFRHHGFDILSGYLIGTATAFFAFRYYHMPTGSGAGSAWGARSEDKAFWAGSGTYADADHKRNYIGLRGDEEANIM